MNWHSLINPLEQRVKELRESLFNRKLYKEGDEKMIYGTFEDSFQNFYNESLRSRKKVSEIDFYKKIVSELETLETGVLNIEDKIHKKENNNIKFPGILNSIFDTKQLAIKCINDIGSGQKKELKFIPRDQNTETYEWLKEHSKINVLYKLLKSENLIAKGTSYKDFELVFNKINIKEVKSPIIWVTSNATELLYFILKLMQEGVIKSSKRLNYLVLRSCFVNRKEKEFVDNFKSLKIDIEIKLNKDSQALIDRIIRKIK